MKTGKLIIGLTGGIGSGKSTVADYFEQLGVDVFDTDLIARLVVAKGTPALAQIIKQLGSDILTAAGELDRRLLRERVFQDDELKQWLEGLLHPRIRDALAKAIDMSSSPYCIAVVPLLIENHPYPLVKRILVVDCDEPSQIARASARDGSDTESIEAIIATQASREQRLALADDVIHNDGDLAQLQQQVEQQHQAYLSLA